MEETDYDFGFSLKELTVFENSKKLFVLKDSKLNQAIQYAADGSSSPSKPFDPTRTLFLTSSPLTTFARVKTTNSRIYISAYGTFGFKVFEFDKMGNELSQVEVLPKSVFNTVLLDQEAPAIEFNDGVLFAAITTSREDAPIIKQHFGVDLDWQGPRYQVVLQTFDDKFAREKIRLVKGSGDFFVSGLAASLGSVAVFGSSGEIGNRKALVVVYSDNLQVPVRSEFTIEGETDLNGATFLENKLYVAGYAGFCR